MTAALLGAREARASGLSTARFGGEHGHVTTDNPTAIYYNPAGIALKPGTRIFVDGSFAARWVSYDRPESAISSMTGTPEGATDANAGTAKLSNFIAGPFAGASSDFGTKFFSAGAAVYFPFGGQSTWKPNDKYRGSQDYPGAVDGVQRWHTIDGKLRSMYITGAVAFNIAKIGLSIGLSGSAIRSEIDTIRARNSDGTDDLVLSDGTLKEGRSWLKASGWQGSFGIGAIWNWRDKLWIGASYTSRPNITGNMTLKGELTNAFGVAPVSEATPIELTQRLPDIVRFGFRVRPVPKLELRLFGDFTNWKVMDKQCVLDASIEGRKCDFAGGDTALTKPEEFGAEGDGTKGVTQHIPRFWKPAGGVRFGASYWVVEAVELFAGLGFDSSAVPVQTIEPALLDSNKMTFSLGGRFRLHQRLHLGVTFTDIAYFKVDTKGRNVLNKFQAPTKQASADGVYKQNIFLTNIYLDVNF
ncbi:OmpP1/FadL family transporter [Nannocystis radixulma]|uniref:Outer membrane protein transport protein n=1 Tax=Nannocystis radixulma TaxID=2995305 RepID=A0ABT5BIC6_9BACT|nr:outer membrane protein transport protein [Nannocystis radixulma]MDC0673857.1 outer membrane protein transport protein [Nannocystis radixulma]